MTDKVKFKVKVYFQKNSYAPLQALVFELDSNYTTEQVRNNSQEILLEVLKNFLSVERIKIAQIIESNILINIFVGCTGYFHNFNNLPSC